MEEQAITIVCAAILFSLLFVSRMRTRLHQEERKESQSNTVRDTLVQIQDELEIDPGVGRESTRIFDLAPVALIGSLSNRKGPRASNSRGADK